MNENPTVEMYDGITYDGSGTGQFTSNLVNLYGQTTYYVRAWAQNEAGISYGDQLSFTTYYGIVTDIDGNSYNTVMIGDQEWMAENLRTTSVNIEEPIPEVTDDSEWAGDPGWAYCWYDNNGDKYGEVYGALYNYHVIFSGLLCPVGWRVPTRDDWDTLIETAGGPSVAGGKLKSTTVHWQDPNAGATNEFSFNALPGGIRTGKETETASAGEFVFMGEFGVWAAYAFTWEGDSGGSIYLMHYNQEYALEGYLEVKAGVSVRCIRGEPTEIEIIGSPPGVVLP